MKVTYAEDFSNSTKVALFYNASSGGSGSSNDCNADVDFYFSPFGDDLTRTALSITDPMKKINFVYDNDIILSMNLIQIFVKAKICVIIYL